MNPPSAAPPRQLALLTAGVLAAHALVLQPNPVLAPAAAPRAAPAFTTRTVVPAPATAPVPLAPAAAAAPAPRPARITRTAGPTAPRAAADADPATAPATPSATGPEAPGTETAPAAPSAATAASAPARDAANASEPGTAPPAAFAVLAPTRLRYEVVLQARGLTLGGQAELHWRHDGHEYEARLELSAPLLPSRVQRSQGRITAQGLAPTYFAERVRGEQATHFDQERGRVVFSNNRPEAALAAGMQDRLSVVLQLAAMVAARPERYPAGARIDIPTASTREAETWTFTVEGEEDLLLPGGAVTALKLQRLPRREFDVKVELWLAPRMDYAPVRLRLTNPNGDAADQRWSSTDKG